MTSKKSTRKSSRKIQQPNQLPMPSSRSSIPQKRVLPNLTKKVTKSRSKSPPSNKVVIAFQSRYERIQNEFSINSTIQEVLEFFKNKLHLPELRITQTFINGVPRKQFKLSDKSKTLKELKITERTAFLYQD